MTAHDLMIKTDHYLIKGGKLSKEQRAETVSFLLAARDIPAVRCTDVPISDKRRMYPLFYIPPQNTGKKLKTILGQTPKTQILSANMYELEVLRILHLLAPDNREVTDMIKDTHKRLKTTCFGYMDDGVGECFDASLVVLRFIAATAQDETEWIRSRIDNYNRHCKDRERPWYPLWYYWLCLSELPRETADSEILRHRDEMRRQYTVKRAPHPICPYILQNILVKYPQYF